VGEVTFAAAAAVGFSTSSIGAARSSQIASTLARLWNDEALSKDEPSTVIVCELGAVPAERTREIRDVYKRLNLRLHIYAKRIIWKTKFKQMEAT